MDQDNKWKKEHKAAACTKAPWEYLIPPSQRIQVMSKINQECMKEYGYSLTECPKRKVCIGKNCIGRPLPFKSETALPYLKELAKSHKIVNEELIVETDCSSCPLFKTCKKPCQQVNDFLNRDLTIEPKLRYVEDMDSVLPDNLGLGINVLKVKGSDIPWDCLDERRRNIIHYYLYEQKDFKIIGEELGISRSANVKYYFYSSLTKLSEYATMRQFIYSNPNLSARESQILRLKYLQNHTNTEIAEMLGITKQTVGQMVQIVIDKFKLKWYIFVRKVNGKPVYNTTELLSE